MKVTNVSTIRLKVDYVLYVDDMLTFGSNLHIINDIKSMLSVNFNMKDLVEADVILGIKITRTEKWNFLRSISLHRKDSKEVQLLR